MEPISNIEMQEKMWQHFEQAAKQTLENARMDLRDRFAMAALTGLLSSMSADYYRSGDEYVEMAYQTADKMLKARERK
jgi:hypothetical protein